MAAQPGKRKLYSNARNGEPPLFLYNSQVYLRSVSKQLMEQQNSFLEFMWMFLGKGCFGTFCTLGYCLVLKRYQMSLSAQLICVGVEYHVKSTVDLNE